MKNKLIIIGAGGHGKVIADIAVKMEKWQSIAFLDDDASITSCLGFDVIGKVDNAFDYIPHSDFFVAVGNNAIRENIQEKLDALGASLVSLIHPQAVIGTTVEINEGTVVMAGAVINSETKIGKGCIINTCASLDHDNLIEDYVHISPGVNLAGNVKIGKGIWIGIGSAVCPNIEIGSGCTLGAGAVVVKDITEPGTYVGVPAQIIDR